MALVFMDGFDHYPAAEILNKWTTINAGATFATGRFGGSAFTTNRDLRKVLTAESEWIVGMGFKYTGGNSGAFCNWLSGATGQNSLHIDTSSGIISARMGSSAGTVVGTGTKVLSANVWYFIEWRLVIANAPSGIANVYIDGVEDIDITNGDTLNTSATADRITLTDITGNNAGVLIDDLYVLTSAGPAPYNTFLGDHRIETLYPNGNGNSSQLVGQDANSTDNYLNVDETDSDDDTTYNESAVVGNKDTYAMANLATTAGTVSAVQPALWARKTDSGPRTVCSVARVGATEEDSVAHSLSATYTYYFDIRTEQPGGGAWTIADINSAEFGMKIVS